MFSIANPPHAPHKILIFDMSKKKTPAFFIFDALRPPPSQTNTFLLPRRRPLNSITEKMRRAKTSFLIQVKFLRSLPVKRGASEKDVYVNGAVSLPHQSARDHKKKKKKKLLHLSRRVAAMTFPSIERVGRPRQRGRSLDALPRRRVWRALSAALCRVRSILKATLFEERKRKVSFRQCWRGALPGSRVREEPGCRGRWPPTFSPVDQNL